jgi:hypothetical protein
LQLVAVNVDIKRNIVMYADFADLKVGTLTMERGAEINVGDRGLTNGVPSTAHGSDLNGGAYRHQLVWKCSLLLYPHFLHLNLVKEDYIWYHKVQQHLLVYNFFQLLLHWHMHLH